MSIIDYLKPPKSAKRPKKRRGRGAGSGHGGTSCRGHKGQQARGSTKRNKGFEGGQMPLVRRIPKRGFNNRFRKEYQVVNIKSLDLISEQKSITPGILKEKALIKDSQAPTKVLGDGKLKKSFEVYAHAFSKSAKKAIEDAGGKAVIITKREG